MRCSSCGKTISQRSSFCMYCGQKVLKPPPSEIPEKPKYSEEEQRRALADCYRLLLGEKHMSALARLADINMEQALKVMQYDVQVALGVQPTLTREERQSLVDDLLNQFRQRSKRVPE